MDLSTPFAQMRNVFASREFDERTSEYHSLFRTISTPRASALWVADITTFSAKRYDITGRLKDSVSIDRWKTPGGLKMGSSMTLPDRQVTDVAEDAAGRLWVYWASPRSGAKTAWSGRGAGTEYLPPPHYMLWHTVVDVVGGNRVLATLALPGYVVSVLGSNRVVLAGKDNQRPTLKVVDLTLVSERPK